jgi:hypothetical protein
MPHNFDSPLKIDARGRVDVHGPTEGAHPDEQVAIWLIQGRPDNQGAFARYTGAPDQGLTTWSASSDDPRTEHFGGFEPGDALGIGVVTMPDGSGIFYWMEELKLQLA